MKYYIYWYHLPKHTDFTKEGYIGITNNIQKRKNRHNYNKESGVPYKFYNALRKHGDNVLFKILCITTKEHAYHLEEVIRPHDGIGWNTVAGGGYTPDCTGNKHSEETKRKISESNRITKASRPKKDNYFKGKKRWSDEDKIRIGNQHRGKKISESHKKAITEKNSGANNSRSINIQLIHKDKPEEVLTFVSLTEAAKELCLNYSSLREQWQMRRETYNRKGYKMLFTDKVEE